MIIINFYSLVLSLDNSTCIDAPDWSFATNALNMVALIVVPLAETARSVLAWSSN